MIILTLAGVSIVSLNAMSRATANSLMSVSMTVAAPVPSQPPIIGLPVNGQKVYTSRTTVAGDCPIIDPQIIVQIYLDNLPAGSGICDASNQFMVAISLPQGTHEIVAQSYTIDGTPAHIKSNPTKVTYTQGNMQSPLNLLSSQNSLSFLGASKSVAWDGTLSGGDTGSLNIDWGDGGRSTQDVRPGAIHVEHHYGKLISHNVLITYANAKEQTQTLQYAVAAYHSYQPQTASGSTVLPLQGPTIIGLYGLYLTCLSICGTLWIIERHHMQEVVLLHHD